MMSEEEKNEAEGINSLPSISENNQKLIQELAAEQSELTKINGRSPSVVKIEMSLWESVGENGEERPTELLGMEVKWMRGNNIVNWIME